MDSVTINEIRADPEHYHKMLFSRLMCCGDVSLKEYITPTTIAEINFRSTKGYSSYCYWEWKTSDRGDKYGFTNAIELRLTQEQAKLFAKVHTEEGLCMYLTKGTVYFLGQIESNNPVMYLKEYEFQ